MKGNGRERQGKEEGSADAELGIREPRLCGSACRAAPRTVGAPPAPRNPHSQPHSSTVPPALSRSSSGFAVGVQGTPPSSRTLVAVPALLAGVRATVSPTAHAPAPARASVPDPTTIPPGTGVLVPPQRCIYPNRPRDGAAEGWGGLWGQHGPQDPLPRGTCPTWPSKLLGGSWCP